MSLNQLDFICDYCSRSFTRKYNLRIHIENCHLNTSTVCEVCQQSFGSPSGLHLHRERGHNRNKQGYPECDLCGRIFKRKQNIVSHMITIHLQGSEIRCKLCHRPFTTQRNLKRHIHQIHNPAFEYLECNDCSKLFKGKHSLIAHIQSTHHHTTAKFVAKCHLCNKVYTNNRNLKRHIESNHGMKEEFRCCLCPKFYTSNQSLKRHVKIRHNPKSPLCQDESQLRFYEDLQDDLTCGSCNMCFNAEPLLRRHIKTEHSFKEFYRYCRVSLLKIERKVHKPAKKETLYSCEFCKSVFTNVYDLKDHMRANHDKEYCLSTCNVCFNKFFSKETMLEHKKICFPPANANPCSYCDRLFTDISSMEFHTRIFHPQSQIADSDITSTNQDDITEKFDSKFQCKHCRRLYYSERSLKHHIKLKHTTDEAVECVLCHKICNNKYYLASHMKIVHTDTTWSKCDYCDKQFKSKRNIRRHIEYTHLGMQRYKCIECETLFKEKRSLRKHVRTKHADSATFPQCHICQKRFESAKSCKIHLKLVHSFNMNTHPCHMCSVSFSSYESLKIHLQTSHLAEDEIYKCEDCNLVFKGHEKFGQHNEVFHVNLVPNIKQKVLPRCIICMKDFSTRKTLKRHIKKFHVEFEPDELANYGCRKRVFNVECEVCIKKFNEDLYYNLYQKLKHLKDTTIFNCDTCCSSYNVLEYAIQRYKQQNLDCKSKMILSELCTAEMSDDDEDDDVDEQRDFGFLHEERMEPESTTSDIKQEPADEVITAYEDDIKSEPVSP